MGTTSSINTFGRYIYKPNQKYQSKDIWEPGRWLSGLKPNDLNSSPGTYIKTWMEWYTSVIPEIGESSGSSNKYHSCGKKSCLKTKWKKRRVSWGAVLCPSALCGHMHAVPRFILTAAGVKVSLGKLFSDYECKFDTRQFYLYSVLCFCTCLMTEKFLQASLSSYPHVNWIWEAGNICH